MATRTRYKSPSPVPSSLAKPLEPATATATATATTTTDALSSSHFQAQYPQFQSIQQQQPLPPPPASSDTAYYDPRFSSGRYSRKQQPPDLPILSYHNAVPELFRSSVPAGEPVSVVLPPVRERYADDAPAFAYVKHAEEKPRSLSIQSLISSPGLDMGYGDAAQGRKRKGSDADEGVRGTRHGSLVPTSVSIEDPDVREVVEALGGLKGDFTPTSPPLQQHPLPRRPENEPLINLITHRAHPLLSSAITTSLSAYGASKSYSASFRYAAESVENRVGLPVSNVVSAVGRRTGLEGVLRRGLQRTEQRPDNSKKRKTRSDADKKVVDDALGLVPVERELESQTWQKRLMLSTSGLGVALNDESLKNLKYCLQWLRFLNVHLSKLVTALRSVVEELDNHQQQVCQNGVVEGGGTVDGATAPEREGPFGRILPACENRRVQLAARVENLKAEVVGTMKKVVEVVSNYTGSALPDNARDLIKRHIFSLPQRFAAASASSPPSTPSSQLVPSTTSTTATTTNTTTNTSTSTSATNTDDDDDANSPRSSANRVLVLAKEGLDMMQQVSVVVEGTIIRAEEWCERLGKKKREEEEEGEREGAEAEDGPEKKRVSWKKKFEGLEERRDAEGDVAMNGRD